MNKRTDPGPAPLAGLRPPAPPAGLREAVLKAAGEALARPVPDRWTLLWRHPAARAAWAFTTALLVLGHLFVQFRAAAASPAGPFSAGKPGPELAEIASLPRINMELVPFPGDSGGSGERSGSERRAPARGGLKKETRS
jgi:hypothetical protein